MPRLRAQRLEGAVDGERKIEVGLADKVRFLSRPETYPEGVATVEIVETHMSCVFLTERHAYKLKKPVHTPVLDFSTVAARRRHCLAELRLNKRLAADVYLAVIPLVRKVDGSLALDGRGEPVDWLVKMRRLPAACMLDRAIKDGTVRNEDIDRVGHYLARFYQSLPAEPVSGIAYRRRYLRYLNENARELANPRYRLPAEVVARVHGRQQQILAGRRALFDARAASGKIVEGHGDLRPEHICLQAQPAVIDCLEFKRAFRIVDPLDELIFLALECDRLGSSRTGDHILAIYEAQTGDHAPRELLLFYKGYRACMRAKLAAWHLDDSEVRDPEKWRRAALDYLRRADACASGHLRP